MAADDAESEDEDMPDLEPAEAAPAAAVPEAAAPPENVAEALVRMRTQKEEAAKAAAAREEERPSGATGNFVQIRKPKRGEEADPSFQLRIVHDEEKEAAAFAAWEPEERRADETLLQPCDEEYCERELGYPKWPKEMKDPDYFRKEMQKMRTDPRYNKNLGRGAKDQEFWNEAARMPWAKVLLRKEQHWTDRRNVWLEQYNTVMKSNRAREDIYEMLEDCPIEVKRLVAPIAKYKIVEGLLLNVYQEMNETGVPFAELMCREETLSELCSARKRLDAGGDAEAQRLQDEMDHMVKLAEERMAEERRREEEQRGRIVVDMQGLKIALDFGEKCKKDGLVEWKRDNFEEAAASWRQADETLRKFRAPLRRHEENKMLADLHGAVLRNLAQAALKLENWSEAADVAQRALDLDPEDHKAWFRKACALEGMGNFDDARTCLERIEEIAVGRPDRERLAKDCRVRRERFAAAEERNEKEQQRMLQRGLRKGVFSIDRQEAAAALPEQTAPAENQQVGGASGSRPAAVAPAAAEAEKAAEGRRRLTRDGAWDVLADLEEAYKDPWFLKRVDKLIVDVMLQPRVFMEHLPPLALEAQKPVLEKWGFEPTAAGLLELRAALREHTRGPKKDQALKDRAEAVHKALHGSPHLGMYDRVMVGS